MEDETSPEDEFTEAADDADLDGAAEADAQIAELEEQITLVDAAMSHLDADDLEAAEAAVGQLDQGNDPTLFAAPSLEPTPPELTAGPATDSPTPAPPVATP